MGDLPKEPPAKALWHYTKTRNTPPEWMAMGYFLLAKLELSGQPAAEQWGQIGENITLQSVLSLTGFAAAWKDFSAWLDNAIQISPSPTSFQTRCFKAPTFRGTLPPPHGL